jgi:flagellar L-ring protein precursor FlgH
MKKIITFLILAGVVVQAEEGALVSRLYADRTARRVGDLVTVQIEEQSSVKKDAADSRDKSVSGNASFNFPGMEVNGESIWGALKLPEWTADAAKSYGSSGSKASSDNFSASITVHITELLPNGNLMITGDRKVNIDGDIIKFTLSGMIRPDDIDRSNAVLSSRIAGATISYETVGEFSRSQRKGILSRVVDWIFPF